MSECNHQWTRVPANKYRCELYQCSECECEIPIEAYHTIEQLSAEVTRLREGQVQTVNKMADKHLPAYRAQSLELLAAIQRAEAAERERDRYREALDRISKLSTLPSHERSVDDYGEIARGTLKEVGP